jgi:hypothetical protein
MLIYTSMALIVLLSCYVTYYTIRNKQKLTCMAGMMVAMTNSMMVSISLGAILGTFSANKDLALPMIVSVSIGMIIGYLTGRPVSLMAAIDGLTAGIMGGMMGSMLGVMLHTKTIDFIIYFVDVIFVLVMVLLIRMIDEEIKSRQEEPITRKPMIANPFVLMGILVFMGVLVFGNGTFIPINKNQVSTEPPEFTPTSNSIQEVTVNPTEYNPDNLVLKAGTPSIINFKTEKIGCTGSVISSELGFNVALKENTNNYVNIQPLKPGTYNYSCGMGMYEGTITVVD